MNKTIGIYNQNAAMLSARYEAFTPVKIRELVHAFFKKGAPTVDIGSGSGRDTAYLNSQGYPTTGVEASDGMRAEANRLHPGFTYQADSLPELATVENGVFTNLLSNAVLMHLTEAELVKGVMNLLRVLATKGRAVVSFRGPSVPANDQDRQFSIFTNSQVAELLESLGGRVLLMETVAEEGITWNYLVFEKTGVELRDGIARIQEIITNDTKTATYKLALLRGLCDLARNESHTVFWDPKLDFVVVPVERLALSWLRYYWEPLKLGIKQTTSRDLAFAGQVRELIKKYPNPRDAFLDYESGNPKKELVAALKKIANTIDVGPVQHAGGASDPVFHRRTKVQFGAGDPAAWKQRWFSLGGIKVPAAMWRDIRLFHHWIEKSLVMEWVELTARSIDTSQRTSRLFEVFSNADYFDKRDTTSIRNLLKGRKLRCIWTGKALKEFHVDHVIPYSVWRNNDFWNLLPACAQVNTSKNLFLPRPETIRKNGEVILEYWGLYQEQFKDRFEQQAVRALGMGDSTFTLAGTLDRLSLISAQLHSSRGIKFFD